MCLAGPAWIASGSSGRRRVLGPLACHHGAQIADRASEMANPKTTSEPVNTPSTS